MKCTYCKRDTIRSIFASRVNHPLTRTRDHVVPLSRGGLDVAANRVIACLRCNGLKGNMLPHEWTEYMSANPGWFNKTRRERRWIAPTHAPLPIEESRIILTYGKKFWRSWRAPVKEAPAVCPVMTMVSQFFYEKRYGVWKLHADQQHGNSND